jgi:hypothetical protein
MVYHVGCGQTDHGSSRWRRSRFNQSYWQERKLLQRELIEDGVLQFSGV